MARFSGRLPWQFGSAAAAGTPYSGLWLGLMAGWRGASLIVACAAVLAMFGAPPALAGDRAAKQAVQLCGADEIARGTAVKILDGRTFVLDDGREVRLAGIEVAPLVGAKDRLEFAGHAAAAAPGALAAGDEVVLRRADSGSDRYGRLFAYAYTVRDGDEFLVQRELVAEGLARVGGRTGRPCAGDLLDHEKRAREAKLPYYEVLDAESPRDALAHRGQFALVEGKVASVRENGPTIYVNFGQRRIGDITVTILKRNERSFATAGL